MPILNIEIVIRPGEHINPKLAVDLANRAGEVFGSSPGNTWVKVQLIDRENYAENISDPGDVFPVFVSVLKAKLPSRDLLQAEAAELCVAIANLCNRPQENVHIIYLHEGADRVAFGGNLIHS